MALHMEHSLKDLREEYAQCDSTAATRSPSWCRSFHLNAWLFLRPPTMHTSAEIKCSVSPL